MESYYCNCLCCDRGITVKNGDKEVCSTCQDEDREIPSVNPEEEFENWVLLSYEGDDIPC